MKITVSISAFWLATALAQGNVECTSELASTDDCADVINPAACYNMFQFRNAQTLGCIDGVDDADRARKVRMVTKHTAPDR